MQDAIVAAKDGAVAWEEKFCIILNDPFQRCDVFGEAGAVMGVDDTDAAVLVDVIAAEEEIAELEAELSRGVSGGAKP